MANNLGNYFHEQRLQQGLSLGELARKVGYRNVSKGANRIARFEREGRVTEDLLATLAEALGIDLQTVEALIDQDRQEHLRAWEEWVSEPVPMCLIVRYLAAVYGTVPLPQEITTHEQAEAFACEYAKQHGRKVCLAFSRRHSVWIDAQGEVYARTEATPDDPNVPFMRLQGSGKGFLMRFGDP
jgi:transcriptional regulator with XRE-family HTH domain